MNKCSTKEEEASLSFNKKAYSLIRVSPLRVIAMMSVLSFLLISGSTNLPAAAILSAAAWANRVNEGSDSLRTGRPLATLSSLIGPIDKPRAFDHIWTIVTFSKGFAFTWAEATKHFN